MRSSPLNPGRPPERRTPLARGAGPRRRKRLVPISDKRIAERPERAEMRELVFARDRGVCRLAHLRPGGRPCLGPLTVHHLRKEGQGGPYTMVNLLTLCASHNDWVEEAPGDAVWLLGLVCRRADTFEDVWGRLVAAGIVDWWWNGERPRS